MDWAVTAECVPVGPSSCVWFAKGESLVDTVSTKHAKLGVHAVGCCFPLCGVWAVMGAVTGLLEWGFRSGLTCSTAPTGWAWVQ